MFMISFTINGLCITNRIITEIWNMFDKLSLIKILKDKKFQMILQGKKSGLVLCQDLVQVKKRGSAS